MFAESGHPELPRPALTGKGRAFIRHLFARARYLRRQLIVDNETQKFIHHNRKVWEEWKITQTDAVILVDLYHVGETLISYSYFLNVLARKHNAQIKSFSRRRRIPNFVLHKVYQSFNTGEHLVISLNQEQECRQATIFQEILPRLRTKQEIFDLKILGVWIGIDIYETYLRQDNKPTLFLGDPKLFDLVKEGIGQVIFWKDYFRDHNVKAVVVSHDCYLPPNVVCKVAYEAGVPVYLPNIRGITYAREPHSVWSVFRDYREMFSRLSLEERRQGVALAKRQLARRFKGEVGVDMPYAIGSAFRSSGQERRILRESEKTKVLICSHCFFDNPHGYGGMLFLDFCEWLRFVGRIALETSYDWYLKVHPVPREGTLETIRGILEDFPVISLIPPETPHDQLVKEGIDFVLTVYGSVGHEYPAFGVQVINAGYNPHVAYDFNWHPKSLEEYEWCLRNLAKLRKAINVEEVYEFYYMHHYYVIADDLILKSYSQSLQELSTRQRIGSAIYGYFLRELTGEKHAEIISTMEGFIDSGKRHYFTHGPEG